MTTGDLERKAGHPFRGMAADGPSASNPERLLSASYFLSEIGESRSKYSIYSPSSLPAISAGGNEDRT